jgi:UDP-N-acetylmuramate--alanine ligase
MHIFFSGIGGTGIGPLALIAKQAGFEVSGSDKKASQYTEYLQNHDIPLYIGQTYEQIEQTHQQKPIDWIVFSSAVFMEQETPEEMEFAQNYGIKTSKRGECLQMILDKKNLKLIAAAGTHGKTTTTAMLVWLFKEMGVPVSYSVGAKISFGPMGQYDEKSEYFVYECDEFDRNFLEFTPEISVYPSIDWDHHEIYKTRDEYKEAFRQFANQTKLNIMFENTKEYLELKDDSGCIALSEEDNGTQKISLLGLHNRKNARLCVEALEQLGFERATLLNAISTFPGTQRRFEKITENLYSDYAHTPEEISATLQLASETKKPVIVVYEPLTNRRQHYMKDQYGNIFEDASKVYWLPSYLARESSEIHHYTPNELIEYLSPKTNAVSAELGKELKEVIEGHLHNGDLVICMAGGGASSLDEWLRDNFSLHA